MIHIGLLIRNLNAKFSHDINLNGKKKYFIKALGSDKVLM